MAGLLSREVDKFSFLHLLNAPRKPTKNKLFVWQGSFHCVSFSLDVCLQSSFAPHVAVLWSRSISQVHWLTAEQIQLPGVDFLPLEKRCGSGPRKIELKCLLFLRTKHFALEVKAKLRQRHNALFPKTEKRLKSV